MHYHVLLLTEVSLWIVFLVKFPTNSAPAWTFDWPNPTDWYNSQTEKHSTKLPGEQYLVTFDIFYSVFNFKIISAIIYCNLSLINACCMAQEGAGNLMSLFSLKNCQQSSLLVLIKKIGMFFKSLRFDSETFKIANSL